MTTGIHQIHSIISSPYDIDYQLIVLSDYCADRDGEVQRVLMEKVFARMTKVVTSQEFMEALEGV